EVRGESSAGPAAPAAAAQANSTAPAGAPPVAEVHGESSTAASEHSASGTAGPSSAPSVGALSGADVDAESARTATSRHVPPGAPAHEAWAPSRSLSRELVQAGAPIQLGLLAMFVGSEGGYFVLN